MRRWVGGLRRGEAACVIAAVACLASTGAAGSSNDTYRRTLRGGGDAAQEHRAANITEGNGSATITEGDAEGHGAANASGVLAKDFALCYARVEGICWPLPMRADGASCFATEALCKSGGETCYAKVGGSESCVRLQQAPDFKSCFPTAALCEWGGASCYAVQGGSCSILQKEPDGVSCFASEALCRSGGVTCYQNTGLQCEAVPQVADNATCFSSLALCVSGGERCYAMKGGVHCVMLQRKPDHDSCFETPEECQKWSDYLETVNFPDLRWWQTWFLCTLCVMGVLFVFLLCFKLT